MARLSSGLLVLGLVAALVAGIAAEEKKPQTIKGWGTVVDPDGDCRVEEKDGTVTITVPNTNHDLTYSVPGGKFNAPRIVREVEGDFTLQVNIPKFPLPDATSVTTGQFTFVSAGLLVWQDDRNFFRIERASVSPEPFAYLGGILDGQNARHEVRPITDIDTVLRAERKGNKLTFSARAANDANWTELLSETFEGLPAKLQVGVESVNTINKEFPAKFQALELTQ